MKLTIKFIFFLFLSTTLQSQDIIEDWAGGYYCKFYFGYWNQHIKLNADSTFTITILTDMGAEIEYPKGDEKPIKFQKENNIIRLNYKNKNIDFQKIETSENELIAFNKRNKIVRKYYKKQLYDSLNRVVTIFNSSDDVHKLVINYFESGVPQKIVGYPKNRDEEPIICTIEEESENYNRILSRVNSEMKHFSQYTRQRFIIQTALLVERKFSLMLK